jgi:hypothetical protein
MATSLSPSAFDVRHSDGKRLPDEAQSGRLRFMLRAGLRAAINARTRVELNALAALVAIGSVLALGLTIVALAAVTATVRPVSTASRTTTGGARPESPADAQSQIGTTACAPVYSRSPAGRDCLSRD